ncbi:MAG: amino acid adenylation domain-containing protein, partial [bacterium]|nr:amino acid adenylation domain-containing protein [bacterium]
MVTPLRYYARQLLDALPGKRDWLQLWFRLMVSKAREYEDATWGKGNKSFDQLVARLPNFYFYASRNEETKSCFEEALPLFRATSVELSVNETHLTATVLTIGKPIDNTYLLILDKNRKLVPIGITG